MGYTVSSSECTGCGQCAASCPAYAISIEDGKAVIGDACLHCGHCLGECPVNAIKE